MKTEIIMHCGATPNGDDRFTAARYRKWHMDKGWRDIGYHGVVEIGGNFVKGRSETSSGAHTRGHNKQGLGLCQVGTDKFFVRQFLTTRSKVREWMDRYNIKIDKVFGHYQFANKSCPGFKIEPFREFIKDGDLNHMLPHILDPASITMRPGEDMADDDEPTDTDGWIRVQPGDRIIVEG